MSGGIGEPSKFKLFGAFINTNMEIAADIRSGETGHDVETDFLRSVEERTVVMMGL